MNNQFANVVVVDRNAYIPTYGIDPDGASINIEPIYKVEIDVDEICKYVSLQISSPMRRLNLRTEEDYKPLTNLLPNATGTKSWKKLCFSGVSYIVERMDKNIVVSKSSLDEKGRWIYKKENRRAYPEETNLQTIISDIVNDCLRV